MLVSFFSLFQKGPARVSEQLEPPLPDPLLLRQQLQWQMPAANEIVNDLPDDLYQVLVQTLSQNSEERTLELVPLIAWAQPLDRELCPQAKLEPDHSSDMDSTIPITIDKSGKMDDVSSAK